MNLRSRTVQARLIVILLAGLLGYAYFGSTLHLACYRVRKAEIARLAAEVAEKERKIALAESQAGRLEVLQQRLQEMEADWEQLERLLPREEDMPAFIKDLARLAGGSGVQIDLMQPNAPVKEEVITSRSVEMRVKGNYHEVGKFLSEVANATRVIRTESLTLMAQDPVGKGKGAKSEDMEGTVEATFKATLYMMQGGMMTTRNAEDDNARG
jgi:type IV pilus assembly protein PilO